MSFSKHAIWRTVRCCGLVSILLLAGCTPGVPVDKDAPAAGKALPLDFSLLALGRSLSDGAVDIYDPYARKFDVPPVPPRKPRFDFSVFPSHPDYLPADEDVGMYASGLPGEHLEKLETVDPAPVNEPVPVEKRELPPYEYEGQTEDAEAGS